MLTIRCWRQQISEGRPYKIFPFKLTVTLYIQVQLTLKQCWGQDVHHLPSPKMHITYREPSVSGFLCICRRNQLPILLCSTAALTTEKKIQWNLAAQTHVIQRSGFHFVLYKPIVICATQKKQVHTLRKPWWVVIDICQGDVDCGGS